jgi:hypothetical protein
MKESRHCCDEMRPRSPALFPASRSARLPGRTDRLFARLDEYGLLIHDGGTSSLAIRFVHSVARPPAVDLSPMYAPPPALNLVVIRSTDIERAAAGLVMVSMCRDAHDSGPAHYVLVSGLVFDLSTAPGQLPRLAPDSGSRWTCR